MKNTKKVWMLAAATAFLVSGCADKDAIEFAELAIAAQEAQSSYANMPTNLRMLYEYDNQQDPLHL